MEATRRILKARPISPTGEPAAQVTALLSAFCGSTPVWCDLERSIGTQDGLSAVVSQAMRFEHRVRCHRRAHLLCTVTAAATTGAITAVVHGNNNAEAGMPMQPGSNVHPVIAAAALSHPTFGAALQGCRRDGANNRSKKIRGENAGGDGFPEGNGNAAEGNDDAEHDDGGAAHDDGDAVAAAPASCMVTAEHFLAAAVKVSSALASVPLPTFDSAYNLLSSLRSSLPC